MTRVLGDPQAEREWISCVLCEPRTLEAAPLDPALFYDRACATIARALVALDAEGHEVALASLRARLVQRGELASVGGDEGLLALQRDVPNIGAAPSIAEVIRDYARRRAIRAELGTVLAATQDRPAADVLAALEVARENIRTQRPAALVDRMVSPLEWHAEDPFNERPPERRWLVRRRDAADRTPGWLPAGIVALLAAEGGAGKSTLLMQLALAIGAGTTWVGPLECHDPGSVLLAVGEEDEDEVKRRLFYAVRVMQLSPRQRQIAAARIEVLPLRGAHARVLERDENGNLRPTAFAHELAPTLARRRSDWRAIIIDPLSRFGPEECEIDNAIATATIAWFESLTSLPGGPAVIVAHHVRKGRGTDVGSADVRGASALVDGARFVATLSDLEVERESVGAVLAATKSNYAAKGVPIYLARDQGGALRAMTDAEERVVRSAA